MLLFNTASGNKRNIAEVIEAAYPAAAWGALPRRFGAECRAAPA
jgi:hypothetical protein